MSKATDPNSPQGADGACAGSAGADACHSRLFDAAADAILVFDAATRTCIDCNPAAIALYGRARKELLGLRVTEFSADPSSTEEAFAAVEAGTRQHVWSRRHVRKDGTVFPVEITSGSFRAGRRHVIFGVVRDITERAGPRGASLDAARRQAHVLESMPIALYTAHGGAALRTTWTSPSIERLAGFPAEAFVADGTLWRSRLHPEDREATLRALGPAGGTDQTEAEYRWRCADGTYRWFLDRASVQRDAEGQTTVVGSWLDITSRKQPGEDPRSRAGAGVERVPGEHDPPDGEAQRPWRSGDESRLSPREREVLALVAHGHTNREVAARLGVSVKTVETYRARLMGKLGLRTRAEMVRHALGAGLLDTA